MGWPQAVVGNMDMSKAASVPPARGGQPAAGAGFGFPTRASIRTLYLLSKVALDVFMVALAFMLAYQFRISVPFPSRPVNVQGLANYLPMLVVQVLSVVVVFYANKLYHVTRASSRFDELYSIGGAVSVGTMLAVAISALTFKNSIFELDFPRAMILYAWLLGIVLAMLGREIHRAVWHVLRMRGFGRDRVLVVGTGEAARAIVQKIQWSAYLGYELVGVVNDELVDVAGTSPLGSINDLDEIVSSRDIQEVIIALPENTPRQELVRVVGLSQRSEVAVKIFPDVFEFVAGDLSVDDLGGMPLLTVRDIQLRGWKLSLKRGLDVVGASVGLVLLSPFFMLLALLIRLESPGPVFFCQERMGLDGRPFQMVKFRSMRADAEKSGPGWTSKDDPRRTRIGAWMRRKNIDEFPNLINVLLGEMSLVGPRPEQITYVQKFRQSIPRYMERHREKAGMTGWAQVNGLRGDTSIVERTKYDLWYVENWSLWLDITIIFRTILQMLLKSSAEQNAY